MIESANLSVDGTKMFAIEYNTFFVHKNAIVRT